MNFELTTDQAASKCEYEQFFAVEEKRAPEGWTGGFDAPVNDEFWAYHRSVAEKLGQKKWLSLAWPKEYGGKELGQIDQAIFSETMGYYRAAGMDQGPVIVAPGILEYGSEELKREWLPRIASGKMSWCQGWSEPNSGSDLASLTTTAVRDGDDYLITGRKIWTTAAHRASHMFLLARTDPDARKHQGLTYFLTEMNKPGISIEPLLFIHKSHHYNQVTFDNLRIPKENIVGAENQGWYVTMASANFERTLILLAGSGKRDLEELIEFCKQTSDNGQPLGMNAMIRNRLAQSAIELQVARQWAYYVAWLQSRGHPVEAEVSASKYFLTEWGVRFYNMGLEILGLYGTLEHDSKWARLEGRFEHNCQSLLGWTIFGGTTEVMKNIIALRGLKLPRG